MIKHCFFLFFLVLSASINAQVVKTDSISNADTLISFDTKALEEVVVRGKTPYVKVSDGHIMFDIKNLIINRNVQTAFDILKHVPGLSVINDKVEMVGASSFSLLLNGYNTGASLDQLILYLKSLPAEQVLRVELMRNAPPETGVRGAAVNVIIKTETAEKDINSGIFNTLVAQEKYTAGKVEGAILLDRKKWQSNVNMQLNYNHARTEEITYSKHLLTGVNSIPILQNYNVGGKAYSGQLYADYLYRFNNENNLKASTYLYTTGQNSSSMGEINLTTYNYWHKINNHRVENQALGRIGLDWRSSKLFNAFIYFSAYKGKRDIEFLSDGTNIPVFPETPNSAKSIVEQKYYTINYNISKTSSLSEHIKLSYGIYGMYNRIYSNYTENNSTVVTSYNPKNSIFETSISAYTTAIWNISPQINLTASVVADYYQTKWTEKERRFDIYPTLQLSYYPSAKHIFQFSMASNRNYPTFNDMSPVKVYRTLYNVWTGNPLLKPWSSYNLTTQYIYNQRYVFSLFNLYSRNQIFTLPYQISDKLETEIKGVNFDFQNQIGLSAATSNVFLNGIFSINTNIVFSYLNQNIKNFHGMKIQRNKLFFNARLGTEYKLPLKPTFYISTDFSGNTATIQGLYNILPQFMWGVALSYRFHKDRAIIKFGCPDILNTSKNRTVIDFNGQYERMTQKMYRQLIYLSFSIKFGGFKAQEKSEPDKSRYVY